MTPRPFRIQSAWKENVVYWEGERGVRFDAGWGVEPPVLYIPSPEVWDDAVPEWLVGRYAEVHDRLVRHSAHRVEPTPEGYVGYRMPTWTRDDTF